jgi:hypothetical protein
VAVAAGGVGVGRGASLARAGAVVFHCVEKGLVMLPGSVMSWSPCVVRRAAGTVGRSQAGRLLSDSSKLELVLELEALLLPAATRETVSDPVI